MIYQQAPQLILIAIDLKVAEQVPQRVSGLCAWLLDWSCSETALRRPCRSLLSSDRGWWTVCAPEGYLGAVMQLQGGPHVNQHTAQLPKTIHVDEHEDNCTQPSPSAIAPEGHDCRCVVAL